MLLILVVIGWIYVTLMMAVAEATAPTGTLLGAAITFVFYGLLPMGIVSYILSTPARKRARRAREAREAAAYDASVAAQPDTGRQPPAATQNTLVPPERKEP